MRAVLTAAAYSGILIVVTMELPKYLPYIITPEKYGPAGSVLLLEYWSKLSLAAWIVLGPLLVAAFSVLWHRKKTKQIAAGTPNALLPFAGKRQRNIFAACLVLSLFLSTGFTIAFVMGIPIISGIKAAKEDLGRLSRGEYMSYTGTFNEIRSGHISLVVNDNAPAIIFRLYSQYSYTKGASSSYYFICPIDLGRRLGFTQLRQGEGQGIEIGPCEVKYLPDTHVVTEIRYSQSIPNTSFEQESDAECD